MNRSSVGAFIARKLEVFPENRPHFFSHATVVLGSLGGNGDVEFFGGGEGDLGTDLLAGHYDYLFFGYMGLARKRSIRLLFLSHLFFKHLDAPHPTRMADQKARGVSQTGRLFLFMGWWYRIVPNGAHNPELERHPWKQTLHIASTPMFPRTVGCDKCWPWAVNC